MTFQFFALSLERRRILQVNVTAHPYAAWAAQQIVEAVGSDANVVRLIRDGDGIYGAVFDRECETLASNSSALRRGRRGKMGTRNDSWATYVAGSTIT